MLFLLFELAIAHKAHAFTPDRIGRQDIPYQPCKTSHQSEEATALDWTVYGAIDLSGEKLVAALHANYIFNGVG